MEGELMRRYDGTVQNTQGYALSGIAVTVRHEASGNLALIYDKDGSSRTNPLTSGVNGEFHFYAPNGRYTVSTTDQTIESILLQDATEDMEASRISTDTINADTTWQTSDGSVTLAAEITYRLRLMIGVTSPAAAGFKARFAVNPSATNSVARFFIVDKSAVAELVAIEAELDTGVEYPGGGVALVSADDFLCVDGYITTSARTVLTFQWGQETASGTTNLAAGYMSAWRVG
jgi:hypothetical protein